LKVRDDAENKADTEETKQLVEKLRLLESQAKTNGSGLHSKNGAIAHKFGATQSFVDQYKGKDVEGVIEFVPTGDRLTARLFLSPQEHQSTVILIAGLRAPSTKRTLPDGKEVPGEPFGDEARKFVEDRLLQRKVPFTILGLGQNTQLVAVVKHPKGNIAEFVLKAGLARCNDAHSTLIGPGMAVLRQAEISAKSQKLGIFKEHVAQSSGPANEAVVSRVHSADTIYIRYKNGDEKRITLSSTRQPL
jgi:staphylococcal nuclease domain-containing protein 1